MKGRICEGKLRQLKPRRDNFFYSSPLFLSLYSNAMNGKMLGEIAKGAITSHSYQRHSPRKFSSTAVFWKIITTTTT
jgi:hypothetical protein